MNKLMNSREIKNHLECAQGYVSSAASCIDGKISTNHRRSIEYLTRAIVETARAVNKLNIAFDVFVAAAEAAKGE